MTATSCLTPTALLLMLAVTATASSDAGRATTYDFDLQASPGCADETKAVTKPKARSEIYCSMIAISSQYCDPVAQWNTNTQVCSVFELQVYCHLALTVSVTDVCTAYRKVVPGAATSKCFNKKLAAAWVLGASPDSMKSIVHPDGCSTRPTLQAENIEWRHDGAYINGANSRMTITSSNFMSSSTGFTWLLRLKRTPLYHKVMMDSYVCSDINQVGPHLMENGAVGALYYSTWHRYIEPAGTGAAANVLPADSDTWVNIGVTVEPSNNTVRVFIDNAFLPSSAFGWSNGAATTPALSTMCYCLGCRIRDPGSTLTGIIQAVGIANVTLTEAEVQEFFNQITD